MLKLLLAAALGLSSAAHSERMELTGRVFAEIVDREGGSHSERLVVEHGRGLTEVRPDGVNVKLGSVMRFRGTLQADGSVHVTSAVTLEVAPAPRIYGEKRTLVILTNFADRNVAATVASAQALFFGTSGASVHTIYAESSRGLVNVTGDVVSVVIPYTYGGPCYYWLWGRAADEAAVAAGVDLSQYQHRQYMLPGAPNCGWTGLAFMPGIQSWVSSGKSLGVSTHELGHSFGFAHAGAVGSEYGDKSDFMGSSSAARRNHAPHQYAAGWLPADGALDVTVGGSYAVSALNPLPTNAPQVLRIAKPDTGEWYFVSLRQPNGFDALLTDTSYLDALSIHKHSGLLGAKTTVLAKLPVGASFTDTKNNITITHHGLSGDTSTVGVTFGVVAPPPPPGSDTTPPALTVTSPAPNSTLTGATAVIRAEASDASGIKKLTFYAAGSFLATVSEAPYEATWNLAGMAGRRAVKVVAEDNAGNKTTVSFYVTVE